MQYERICDFNLNVGDLVELFDPISQSMGLYMFIGDTVGGSVLPGKYRFMSLNGDVIARISHIKCVIAARVADAIDD